MSGLLTVIKRAFGRGTLRQATSAQATSPAAPTAAAPPSEALPITPEASIVSHPALAESPQAAAPPAAADEQATSRAEPAEAIAAPIAADPEAHGFEPALEVEIASAAMVVEPVGVTGADLSGDDEADTPLATAAAPEVLEASDAPSDEVNDLAVVASTVVVVEDAEPASASDTSDQAGAFAAEEAAASGPVEEPAADKRLEAPPQEA